MTSNETNKVVNFRKDHLESIARVIGMKQFEIDPQPLQSTRRTAPGEETSSLHETNNHDVHEPAVDRRMSIRRRLAIGVAAGVVGVAVGGNIIGNEIGDSASEHEPIKIPAVGMATVSTGSGLELGAAQQAIREGLEEKKDDMAAAHIDIDQLPVFDTAVKAVKMADENNNIVVDEGDKIKVRFYVVKTEDNNVSLELTDAKVIDLPNNQS